MAPAREGTTAKRSNAARKPPAPEPVELDWQGTRMFGCPVCGHNNESKDWVTEHIGFAHPEGGEGS